MSYSYGRITAPVNQEDVQRALGIAVGGDWGHMCSSEKINKWARYKPQRSTNKFYLSYQDRIASDIVRFGIQIPFCQNDVMNGKVYNIISQGHGYEQEGWNYLRPRGLSYNESFRITDFTRHPNETIPSAGGDPTPVNLQGYNHSALFPFMASINTPGADERQDSYYGTYYEINLQLSSSLIIDFYNSQGDDLHLQDFINFNLNETNIKWRPVLQVFSDYHQTSYDYWYMRSQPDYEVAGDAITTVQTDMFSAALDLTGLSLNQYYHLCVGVGCCDQSSPIHWKEGFDPSLFIIPYTDEQLQANITPFYYVFKVVNYNARKLQVTNLKFFQDGLNRWADAGGTAPYFTINSLATNLIRLTMTITKIQGQPVDFCQENITASHPNTAIKIQARETITGAQEEITRYLTPTNSSWEPQQYVTIPGDAAGTFTIYATLQIGNIPTGQYGQYHMYADTTGVGMFTNIGFMSIHKVQYQ